MLSFFSYESEVNTMDKLIMMNVKVMKNAGEELENYRLGVNEKSPCWLVLARMARYEFMNRVFLELPNYIFDEEETAAILRYGGFLESCWKHWNEHEDSIMETIECVADAMANNLINESDEDMEDESDEEESCAVLIL